MRKKAKNAEKLENEVTKTREKLTPWPESVRELYRPPLVSAYLLSPIMTHKNK
jgi:hypothetical protein